jgi:acyl-coenzyme A thioesterase PaaI-like protein
MDSSVAKEMLSGLPLNRHLGVEVTSVASDGGVCVLPERDELKNHVGTQHAGALFTVGEAASGAVVLGALGERLAYVTPLAKTAKIDFKKPARGPVTATAHILESVEDVIARVERDGKTVFGVGVSLADASGLVVAEMQVDWHLRKNG